MAKGDYERAARFRLAAVLGPLRRPSNRLRDRGERVAMKWRWPVLPKRLQVVRRGVAFVTRQA